MKTCRKLLLLCILLLPAFLPSCTTSTDSENVSQTVSFVSISGENLIAPDGSVFYIQGTNLGNWLNPEGYILLHRFPRQHGYANVHGRNGAEYGSMAVGLGKSDEREQHRLHVLAV